MIDVEKGLDFRESPDIRSIIKVLPTRKQESAKPGPLLVEAG